MSKILIGWAEESLVPEKKLAFAVSFLKEFQSMLNRKFQLLLWQSNQMVSR